MKKFAVLFFCLLPWFALAQDSENYDDFFKDDTVKETDQTKKDYQEDFLVSENKFYWGGRFTSSFTTLWLWYGTLFAGAAEESTFTPDLGADLFFDARPYSYFRVYGKVKFYYPFENTAQTENLFVHELFADWTVTDWLFIRVGKQTLNWGVGYFFSPADFVNLSVIDPQDPEAERQGPLAIKVQIPFYLNNFYFYALAQNAAHPQDLAWASKLELVLGISELGMGVYYHYQNAPRGMITVSSSLWDISWFGEAVLSYGSDKTFIRENSSIAYTRNDEFIFSGTVGFRYLQQDWDLLLVGQYYYNGEGYAQQDFLRHNTAGLAYLIATGALTTADVYRSGQNYLSLLVNWISLFNSDFGLKLFWIGNLNDNSGQISPEIQWSPSDYFSLALSLPYYYGDKGDEFTSAGSNWAFSIKMILASGKF